MAILKVTEKQDFTLSLEDTFWEKQRGGSNWPPSLFRVNICSDSLIENSSIYKWGIWAKNLKMENRNFLIY